MATEEGWVEGAFAKAWSREFDDPLYIIEPRPPWSERDWAFPEHLLDMWARWEEQGNG